MSSRTFSSGDVLVDRRAAYAERLAAEGEVGAAADLLADALVMAPQWAAGWFRLGEWREAEGRTDAALGAYRTALSLDSSDRIGASLAIESLGGEEAVTTAAFMEQLFDQFSDRFDTSLVVKLGYRLPGLLFDAIAAAGAVPAGRTIDLGCGTGLMGDRLRAMTGWLEGVDISGGMLRKAEERKIYDRLTRADLAQGGFGLGFDLAVAADVLVYFRRLDRVFADVAAALESGATFAFSVERNPADDLVTLRPSRRFAHGSGYIAATLDGAGFAIVSQARDTIRFDRGEPVEGLIVVARKK
jgi:predicted TPR repeat methyltransferase